MQFDTVLYYIIENYIECLYFIFKVYLYFTPARWKNYLLFVISVAMIYSTVVVIIGHTVNWVLLQQKAALRLFVHTWIV